MSTRLNAASRAAIQKALMQHTFGERAALIINAYRHLAIDVYNDLYGNDLAKINDLPEGWLEKKPHINVRFGTEYTNLHFSGRQSRMNYEENRPLWGYNNNEVWQRMTQIGVRGKDYDARHPLSIRYEQIGQTRATLEEEFRTANRKAKAILKGFATVEKLIEAWPEIEPFAKKELQVDALKQARQLPVIQREELNSIFDLPVDEVADVAV